MAHEAKRFRMTAITMKDVIRIEHDIICEVLDVVNNVARENCRVNMGTVIPYIDGVRSMAEALLDLMVEDDNMDTVKDIKE